jgi:hypothetical protein
MVHPIDSDASDNYACLFDTCDDATARSNGCRLESPGRWRGNIMATGEEAADNILATSPHREGTI